MLNCILKLQHWVSDFYEQELYYLFTKINLEIITDKYNFTIYDQKHKPQGLQELWENGKSRKLAADQINKIIQILDLIDSAQKVPHDFEFFKSWKIHPLKGEWRGFWSVTVKENWRIIFRFVDHDAFDLNYLDYH